MDPFEKEEHISNSITIVILLGLVLFFGAIFFFIFMVEVDDNRIAQSETYTAEIVAHNSVHGGSEIVLDNDESFLINYDYKYRDMLTPGTYIRYHKEGDGAIHRQSLDIISKPESTP